MDDNYIDMICNDLPKKMPNSKPDEIRQAQEALRKFFEKIRNQQDIPPEFAEILNKHFWDLV